MCTQESLREFEMTHICAVPENIPTHPKEDHWKFHGGGGLKSQIFLFFLFLFFEPPTRRVGVQTKNLPWRGVGVGIFWNHTTGKETETIILPWTVHVLFVVVCHWERHLKLSASCTCMEIKVVRNHSVSCFPGGKGRGGGGGDASCATHISYKHAPPAW